MKMKMGREMRLLVVYVLVVCARCDNTMLFTNEDEDTLLRNGRSVKLSEKDSVEVPVQPFVNAPPAGPMETLSIDIKGDSATYKNFTKNNKESKEDLVTTSKAVSRRAEIKSTKAADDDGSAEQSGDDENDQNEIKADDIVEKEVPKKKRKDLKALVKPINTNANAAATPPYNTATSSSATPVSASQSAPSFAPPSTLGVPSAALAAPSAAVKPPAGDMSAVGSGASVVGVAGASTATTTKKRKSKKKKKKKKKGKKRRKMKHKVLSSVTEINNTTTSKNTSTLPKWAQNLKAWSKNVADGLAAKQKPIQLKKEGSKGGSKSVTLVNIGGTGSTELPPLTPPVVNPLLNDSGELDPQKTPPPPPLTDDGADDEGELPPPKAVAPPLTPPLAPPPPPVAGSEHDPLKSTHAGDEGIDHDTPQEPLKEGLEQGPLPPGHEQGPKLPGHEKGPLLPGQSHAGNVTALQDEDDDEEGPVPPPGTHHGPTVIEQTMGGGHCSPCMGEHGLGVPIMFDQDGSLHCQPCGNSGAPGVGPAPPSSTLKEQYLHDKWAATPHGSPPPDTHEPFQLLLPADPSGPPPSEPSFNPGPPHPPTPLVDEAPPGSPGPVPPPLDSMSITHGEFAKMGEHLNPELLSVIEKNNHKISALWNEVRDVQSRLGNIESVVQVVEKAVQRIESKLGTNEEPSSPGVFVDDPVHQKTLKIKMQSPPAGLPLYPPSMGDYHDPSRPITEGFPHASHHSPVLKQYFIPLQPVQGSKEVRPPSNNGLPYTVNKFLNFLMGELQKERNAAAGPAEVAMHLQNLPVPVRVPHVPLPQPDLPYPPKEHDIERLEFEIGRVPKKFSPKVLHPELDEQPSGMCPCENGGQCISGRSDCDCPIRYTGIRCEKPVPRSPLLDQIIQDLPPETQNQIRDGAHGGMITLPLVIAADREVEEPDQKMIAEAGPSKVVNLLSQFFTPEYIQKFAKRHKVINVRRRYVKYPAEKQK